MKMINYSRNSVSAYVPRNLDMSVFGDNADKVAVILDWMYRAKVYKNAYGFVNKRGKGFNDPVAINMQHLSAFLSENATRILDLICQSKRHKQNGTQPIVEVLVRVKPGKKGVHSALYVFATPFRVKAKIHIYQRLRLPVFKHNKEMMDEMIAGLPENYRTVCENIKMLTLEMDDEKCLMLRRQIRNRYIQDDQKRYVENKVSKLLEKNPTKDKNTIEAKARALWDKESEVRVSKLDEQHYNSLLTIQNKVLELANKREMPVYSVDDQGRLHYYLTNMSEELRPFVRLNGCKVVSYDLRTSQCIFVYVTLREYIRENNITLDMIKMQADEIIETIRQCNGGIVPDFVQEGFIALKRKRKSDTLEDEMKLLGKLLSKDFYDDIMQTIEWKRLPNGQFDRKGFKNKVWFQFLYGKMPSWNSKAGSKTMQYFIQKFPAVYCVLWKMRRFTEVCRDFHRMIDDKVRYRDIEKHITETYKTADFPKEMQKQEANMFFNVIIPQINQPLVTVRDSIIVEAGKPCDVKKIIEQAFIEKYQIKVYVVCERW